MEMVFACASVHGRENHVYLDKAIIRHRFCHSPFKLSIMIHYLEDVKHSHVFFNTDQSKFTSGQLPREQISFT